jgi:DNA polymerase-3 subunit delta'
VSGSGEDRRPTPRDTPELLGQSRAEATLLAAERSGRLPHAWLLTGPPGIGKATLAYRFARFLLAGGNAALGEAGLFGAAEADSLALPPEHPVFPQIAAGGHPDLVTIARLADPKTGKLKRDIAIEQVRAAIGFLHLTAAAGGWRIIIVDSVDEMNRHGANALLKVLEEPPAGALILLISHAPGRVLPTIRSRCRRLALSPLPEAVICDLLARYLPELSSEDRLALARLGDGSFGRALDLADGGGLELYRELLAVLSDLPKLDVAKLHAFGERLARDASGRQFRTGTDLLADWLNRLIRDGAQAEAAPEVVAGEAALRQRLVGRSGLAQWLALWENLTHLFARTESASLDRKQVVITAFLELEALVA